MFLSTFMGDDNFQKAEIGVDMAGWQFFFLFIPKKIQKLVFDRVCYAANFLSSLAPCARTMAARPRREVCAAALSNSQLLNHFRYICFFSFIFNADIEAIDSFKNPFLIDFPEKKDITDEEYLILQNKLRQINLNPLLSEYYMELKKSNNTVRPYDFFYSRCTKFLYQEFINQEENLLPRKELVKINNGGDNCIVCSVPYAKEYPFLLLSQIEALKQTEFNGYYLLFLGAYPNPTGKEIRYAGVPYAFKIFAMIEAQRLGFNKVLWLDSALYPQRDITPIFDEIEKTGFAAHHRTCQEEEFQQIFPTTQALLQNLTSVDVLQGNRIFATLIGLKMDHPLTESFIRQYYELVELGTPFISGLPEEFVFSAILGQKRFEEWMKASKDFENSLPAPYFLGDPLGTSWSIENPVPGYFFVWRGHSWVDNVNRKFQKPTPIQKKQPQRKKRHKHKRKHKE